MRENIQNKFINAYLDYVEKSSESPDIFHTWSAISAAGALSNRNVWLEMGANVHYPNLYTILVGPEQARASNALRIIRKLIEEYSPAKFAPTDTAGARQGLLAALRGNVSYGTSEKAIELEFGKDELLDLDMGAENTACEIYIHNTRFATFLGQKQFDLLECLTYCHSNPPDYSYKLKNSEEYVYQPTINILAATGTESLYHCLPANATGTDFLSKCILVYHGKNNKRMPRPRPLSKSFADEYIGPTLEFCRKARGAFSETEEGADLLDQFYDFTIRVEDTRLLPYNANRFTHLCKIAMCLALLERSTTITGDNVADAQYILSYTETFMADALGDYGMSPVAVARQKIIEILTSVKDDTFLTTEQIFNLMSRDVKRVDYMGALRELEETSRIVRVDKKTRGGAPMSAYVLAKRLGNDDLEKIKNAISNAKSREKDLDKEIMK